MDGTTAKPYSSTKRLPSKVVNTGKINYCEGGGAQEQVAVSILADAQHPTGRRPGQPSPADSTMSSGAGLDGSAEVPATLNSAVIL